MLWVFEAEAVAYLLYLGSILLCNLSLAGATNQQGDCQ